MRFGILLVLLLASCIGDVAVELEEPPCGDGCDDGEACTTDACVDGVCLNEPMPVGAACHVGACEDRCFAPYEAAGGEVYPGLCGVCRF